MTTERPSVGFRPTSRRRNRVAAGAALAAVAIGGNVLVYSSLDDTRAVLQAVVDIPAGTEVTADMLRSVEIDVGDTVQTVSSDDVALVTGRYAKVRIVSGSLVTTPALQSDPLVTPGHSVVAITVPAGALPIGLRERSVVRLVLAATNEQLARDVDGRMVGLPTDAGSALGERSLSVEVATDDAVLVAASDDVRVILLEPVPDVAAEGSAGIAEEAG